MFKFFSAQFHTSNTKPKIGFKHGCKCAVVAPNGKPLHTETLYINFGRSAENLSAAKALKRMVDKFG